jgi:hypothetical protein
MERKLRILQRVRRTMSDGLLRGFVAFPVAGEQTGRPFVIRSHWSQILESGSVSMPDITNG